MNKTIFTIIRYFLYVIIAYYIVIGFVFSPPIGLSTMTILLLAIVVFLWFVLALEWTYQMLKNKKIMTVAFLISLAIIISALSMLFVRIDSREADTYTSFGGCYHEYRGWPKGMYTISTDDEAYCSVTNHAAVSNILLWYIIIVGIYVAYTKSVASTAQKLEKV